MNYKTRMYYFKTKENSKNNDPETKGWSDMDELLEVFKEYVY